MKLKRRNVPVPEAYLLALTAGGALEFFLPRPITPASGVCRGCGGLVLLAGAALALWSVAAVGDGVIDKPSVLLVSGPYRRSRHPMYVAWTLIALGVAFLVNSVWLLSVVPVALLYLQLVEIPREEVRLRALFREQYLAYMKRVRRYL